MGVFYTFLHLLKQFPQPLPFYARDYNSVICVSAILDPEILVTYSA